MRTNFPQEIEVSGVTDTATTHETAERQHQTNDYGDAAVNEHPDNPSFRHRLGLRSSDPLGVNKQQHDPTNERERSDGWRDKVAVGGLNVYSEEIDRLSRGLEGDARVSEHHDAQSDQEDCDDGFYIHIKSSV
jgi:hypothetical protein